MPKRPTVKQEPFSELVPVRLTGSQKTRLLQVSRATGKPVSELVREMIEAEVRRYERAWDSIESAAALDDAA